MSKLSLNNPQAISLSKDQRKELVDKLASLQRRVKELGIPVMILLDGWDASGKDEVINRLVVPLDPRFFIVYPKGRTTHEIRHRPLLYRYWCESPADGSIVLFDTSYYADVYKRSVQDRMEPDEILSAINNFEKNLTDSGTIILKFFLQISKDEQKKRFKKLEKNAVTHWRVGEKGWKQNRSYRKIASQWNEVFSKSNTDCAPWTIVDASTTKGAVDTLLVKLSAALELAISRKEAEMREAVKNVPLISTEGQEDAIAASALNHPNSHEELSDEEYRKLLKDYCSRMRDLEFLAYRERVPVMILFEGFDAAGKGGAIKRLCKNLDPLGYRVYPSSAPSSDEKAHNWLWRYWRAVPKRGHFSIFDRTWYGRVLVEPIEGFQSRAEYERAFTEINNFERYLHDYGVVIIKFWMNISSDEQLKRFEAREKDPKKQWKITDEDWRNRDKRGEYVLAADKMFEKTSTDIAPWVIINGDDKKWARIEILQTVISALEEILFEKSRN